MNLELECISCQMQQIIRTVKISGEQKWAEILPDALNMLAENIRRQNMPAVISTRMQKYLSERMKYRDPYSQIKEKSNLIAEEVINLIIKEKNSFTLKDLCLLSAAGNLMDFAVIDSLNDCASKIMHVLDRNPPLKDVEKLHNLLSTKEAVLFFPDNSGEIVFDKLLIEYIKSHYDIKVYIVANTAPIFNDVTKEEIVGLGLENCIDGIIEKRPEFMGIDLEYNHNYLKKYFDEKSLVISKGMANYECFSTVRIEVPVIAILLAKCPVIAAKLAAEINEPVVKFL